MMKRIYFFMMILMAMFTLSCEQVKDWSDPTDGEAPAPVTNVQVENLNGGAMITYNLPADKDLLGVKAVYALDDGVEREYFASAFTDTIMLEGYGTTGRYTVTLYAMDKSGNVSTPESIDIEPLTPPVDLLRQSMRVQQAFGGIYLAWENILEKEMAITLFVADSTGFMQPYDIYYTNVKDGSTSFRGFDDTERNFSIEIRDRWNNYALPFDTTITPLKEEAIFGRNENNQTIWRTLGQDNDLWKYMGNMYCPDSNWPNYTDGKFTENVPAPFSHNHLFFGSTHSSSALPFYLAIDMQKPASYSRFKWWQAAYTWGVNATVFSLWGTNNPKPVDIEAGQIANLQYWTEWTTVGMPDPYEDVVVNGRGEWMNDWEKLGEYRLVYPMGYVTTGTATAEWTEWMSAGFEFDIDPEMVTKPFRYLRFRVEETNYYLGQGQWSIAELRFWGNFVEE